MRRSNEEINHFFASLWAGEFGQSSLLLVAHVSLPDTHRSSRRESCPNPLRSIDFSSNPVPYTLMQKALEKYNKRVDKVNSLLCVGLDSEFEKLPKNFKNEKFPQFAFNKWIVEQTSDYVSAYKPNMAFYEARGAEGIKELELTMEYLKETHPDIFTICDGKRAEIGNTSRQYAKEVFEHFGFDAVTLNPYFGKDALQPFLDYEDKGCIILCRTSNPSAREFQDILVEGKPLWQVVAEKVVAEWNDNENCLLVAAATYPEELKTIRKVVGGITLLVPGIGAQGGDTKAAVKAGLNSQGKGLILSASRAVIFAENPGDVARSLRDEINTCRLP